MRRLRRWVFAFLALALAWSLVGYFFPRPRPLDIANTMTLPPGARVLVVSPHSDDETLGAGGLMAQAAAAGSDVFVVLITAGDGFRLGAEAYYGRFRPSHELMLRFGEARLAETRAAMAELGVPAEHLLFLGYGDRSLDRLWLECWHASAPCVSDATGSSRVPYADALHPGAPYSGDSLLADLETVLNEVQPQLVVYPHPNDAHVDHWAAHNFVAAALADLALRQPDWEPPEELLYLVHRGDWPAPKGDRPQDTLYPPPGLSAGSTRWLHQPLARWEVERKRAAILAYRSQVRLMRRFLLSFVRRDELFGVLPPVELPPPDAGRVNWIEVVTDPQRDTLARDLTPEADIRSVWAAHHGDSLHLSAQLGRGSTGRVEYTFRVRTWAPDSGWGPLTAIPGRGGPRAARPPAADQAGGPPALRAEGNWVFAQLPLPEPGTDRPRRLAVMVNVETRIAGRLIDRSAWRLVYLAPPRESERD